MMEDFEESSFALDIAREFLQVYRRHSEAQLAIAEAVEQEPLTDLLRQVLPEWLQVLESQTLAERQENLTRFALGLSVGHAIEYALQQQKPPKRTKANSKKS